MNIFSASRRAPWLRGAGLLLSGAVAVGLVGLALGLRVWWAYLGLFLATLLGLGAVERLWTRGRSPRPSPPRSKLKVIPGGKAGHDLTKDDDSTNKQRWLM
jgi:hypothetical protein